MNTPEIPSPQPAHTPAPWVVKFRKDHSAYISFGDPSSHHKQFDIDFDDRYPSDVADARLIAAAPELLAALRRLRLVVPSFWNDHLAAVVELDAACADADAAIAKATGAQA